MTVESNKLTSPIRGDLTYDDKVIEKIIGIALENVDGLLEVSGGFFSSLKDKLVNTDNVTDGVHVEVGKEQVAVDIDIVAEYRKHVPTIFQSIKSVIEREVKQMTDLDVIEVNVKVVDIKTLSQYEADSVSLQDRVSDVTSKAGDFTSEKFKSGVNKVKDDQQPRVI